MEHYLMGLWRWVDANVVGGINMKGMMDGWHGDELEIEERFRAQQEKREEECADDWKYNEE